MIWGSSFFIIQAFRDNLEYYMTPDQVWNLDAIDTKKKIRVGGLVTKIERNDLEIKFTITDFNHQMKVVYHGVDVPPIFKENVGVIVRGYLIDKENFLGEQLIGKHDENYSPKRLEK